jgi:hypothetical protein
MQAVRRLSPQFGEEFVVPTNEAEIAHAKRSQVHRLKMT